MDSEMMSEKQVDANDLMKFLSAFRNSMEEKMVKTNEKLDGRMDEMSNVMKNLSTKVNSIEADNKEVQERMDGRLEKLERAMEKSIELRKKSKGLKELQEMLKKAPPVMQSALPDGRGDVSVAEKGDDARTSVRGDGDRIGAAGMGRGPTPPRRKEDEGACYQSNWAKEMEAELANNANWRQDKKGGEGQRNGGRG